MRSVSTLVIVVLATAELQGGCSALDIGAADHAQRFPLSHSVIPSAVPSDCEGKSRDLVFFNQSAARSFHPGLNCPMSHNFFSRRQPFNCFSRPNRFIHIVEALPIHKTCRVVLICESLRPMRFVLKNAPVQIVSHCQCRGTGGNYFGGCKRS